MPSIDRPRTVPGRGPPRCRLKTMARLSEIGQTGPIRDIRLSPDRRRRDFRPALATERALAAEFRPDRETLLWRVLRAPDADARRRRGARPGPQGPPGAAAPADASASRAPAGGRGRVCRRTNPAGRAANSARDQGRREPSASTKADGHSIESLWIISVVADDTASTERQLRSADAGCSRFGAPYRSAPKRKAMATKTS